MSIAISEDPAGMIRGYAASAIAADTMDGLLIGLLAGIGFVATIRLANYAFESRSVRVYAIIVGYPVFSFLAIGLLLVVWR